MNRNNLARIWSSERDLLSQSALVKEYRHEQRLARQQAFARAHKRAEKTALLLRAVAEYRFHFDTVVHVHHSARFGHGRFIRVQFNFDVLHVVAENFVIDFVHSSHILIPSKALHYYGDGDRMRGRHIANSPIGGLAFGLRPRSSAPLDPVNGSYDST